jgi:hypothetical protein
MKRYITKPLKLLLFRLQLSVDVILALRPQYDALLELWDPPPF